VPSGGRQREANPLAGRGGNSSRHALFRCNAADGKGILLGAECTGVHGRARGCAVVGPHLGNERRGRVGRVAHMDDACPFLVSIDGIESVPLSVRRAHA
jgi:hypothetical protein